MPKKNQQIFLIDFDSTFIKSEGIDELAAVSLKKSKDREERLAKIKTLTQQGMDGKIPFGKSLMKRIGLLQANKSHIEKTAKILKRDISSSILRNKHFFKTYKNNIYIISGGFEEFIIPVVKSFGISENHIFANTFLFDKEGNITGIDTKNPLAHDNGKVKLIKSLKLKGDIYVIGDGYTDYKLKEEGLVKKFIAFTENIEREVVIKKADHIASSFDEFLYSNNLPMSLSYPKSRISVLLLENIDNTAVNNFEREGYTVKYFEKSLAEEDLQKEIQDISILGIRSRTAITPAVLTHANRLMALGVFAIGTNNLNLPALTQKGIATFNAPYSNTRSVVELVLGEIIMLMRHVFEKSDKMHRGIWEKSAKGSHEVKGKTLGIIGYGNIGTQLGLLAENLGMRVCFYDKVEKLILGNAQKCETLEELLKKSDVVTVHVDGNSSNKNLIGEKEFVLMKDGAIFINACRGFVVDEKALITNLKNGKIQGAAIDVFPQEPKSNSEPFISELKQFPNVILTPHIGGSTEEAQKNIARYVSQKLIEYVNTGNTYLSVNLPNIQLPEQKNSHRLLHMHNNVPGIIAQMNKVLAEHNINILGQYLKTSEEIGYVITDVDKKYDKKILDILKQIPNTIRFRVLY